MWIFITEMYFWNFLSVLDFALVPLFFSGALNVFTVEKSSLPVKSLKTAADFFIGNFFITMNWN